MQRKTRIHSKPRFKLASQRAYEFSDELGITEFPVDPVKIIERFPHWHLQGWLDAQKTKGIDDFLYIGRDGAEARTAIVRGTSEYIIVYDERVGNQQRIRWSIAHEIGHIVLGHLVHFEATALNRRGLTDNQYRVLEVEAHWFAAELLAPKIVIKHFNYQNSLGHLCDISNEAVEKRLDDLKRAERSYSDAAFRVLKNFYNYMVGLSDDALPKMHTNNIQLPAIYEDYIDCDYWNFVVMSIRDWEKEAKLYQVLEGSAAFYDDTDMVIFVKGDDEAAYAETGKAAILSCLERYANSPVKNIEIKVASLRPFVCICCGNTDVSPIANFCIICGTSISDKQDGNNGKMVDILNYTDEPNVDSKNRFTQCPICKNSEFSENANYCRICSTHRINLCEGYYETDHYGNHSDEITRHGNFPNARFCEECGSKTAFFSLGVLMPWEEVQGIEPIVQQSPISQTTGFAELTADVDDDDLPF